MLNVLSGGVTDRLVKDTDYKKQVLSYKGSESIYLCRAVKQNNRDLQITFQLPFLVDEIPEISLKNCFVSRDEDNIWHRASLSSNPSIMVSNNTLQFKVEADEDIANIGSYYFLIQGTVGELTLTWGGGVTLKRLFHKIKHFFHREEVLA